MQEPQYRSPGVRELLDAVAKSKVPCMSIMNMPPLPYVKRIPGLNYDALKPAYTDPGVWDSFDPATLTLCSPDPQAIRPPEEKVNVLQVTLPTNFKDARFDSDKSTAILRQLEKGHRGGPLRCSRGQDRIAGKAQGARFDLRAARQVADAARRQLALHHQGRYANCLQSRRVEVGLQFRGRPLRKLGASPNDLGPFEKYGAAAQSLTRPGLSRARSKTARPTLNAPTSWCNSSPSRRA